MHVGRLLVNRRQRLRREVVDLDHFRNGFMRRVAGNTPCAEEKIGLVMKSRRKLMAEVLMVGGAGLF